MNAKRHIKRCFVRFARLHRKSDRFVHLLVGMPSYDKYVEHMRTMHPDRIPKTQKEFFKEALEKKYGAGGARCC